MEEIVATLVPCPDPAPRPRMCAELASQNATLVLDAGGIVRWCSEAARQLLGRPLALVVGRPVAEFVPELPLNNDTPGYNAAYVAFSFGEDRLRACRVLGGFDGAFDADVAVSPLQWGDTRGFVLALHRSCDPMLGRLDMQRLVEALALDEDAALILDLEGNVTHANPAFEALTGFLAVEVNGVAIDTLTAAPGTSRFMQRSALLEQGRTARDLGTCLRRDTSRVHVDETWRRFVDAQGRITHYVLAMRDATDRVAAAERVAFLAHHDTLTGLPNRVLFADRLHQEIARGGRRGTGFALLWLDLDGFKRVNDQFGHAAGDEMLRQVAQQLRECLREEDTLARMGGDEFALILPGTGARAEVEAMCRSVGPRLTTCLTLEGAHVRLSLSAGVACFPLDGRDADALVRAADRAMYSAKRAGGSRVHFAGDGDETMAR